MTMIERVARAILAKVPLGYGMTIAEADEYARAAIEAMREPTDAMWEACGGRGAVLSKAYAAMIDAALNEQVAG